MTPDFPPLTTPDVEITHAGDLRAEHVGKTILLGYELGDEPLLRVRIASIRHAYDADGEVRTVLVDHDAAVTRLHPGVIVGIDRT